MARAFVSGMGWIEKQTKTVDITKNCSVDVFPDNGKLLEKVTVNAKIDGDSYDDGYEAGKAEADAKLEAIDAELEAIDAELDNILAIQNNLLPKEITFTIYNYTSNTKTEYTAAEGMTWAEWCDSKYNTIGAYVDEHNQICNTDGNCVLDGETGFAPDADAVIDTNIYYCWSGY